VSRLLLPRGVAGAPGQTPRGIDDRADVDYILETLQTESGGLKHNEIKEYGCYRTKEWVLAEYDRMAAAEASGLTYESTLNPKPGSGPRHPAR
jgi:hypothetical protein